MVPPLSRPAHHLRLAGAGACVALAACVGVAPATVDGGEPLGDAVARDSAAPSSPDATPLNDAVPAPDAAVPVPDEWQLLDPLPDGVWVRVRNRCDFPLWVHAAGSTGVLAPDDRSLATDETFDYQAPRDWRSARVTAYAAGPRAGEIEKAEMTFEPSGSGAMLNYNITYVDWVGLPMRVAGAGGQCGEAHVVACLTPRAALVTGCPPHLLDGDRCVSARTFCLDPANQPSAYCHALDGAIADCAANVAGCSPYGGATTPQAYACSDAFAEEPRLCAALNRGMLSNPDSADANAYYAAPPYNTYAKWVHEVCPGIYAFPYDDWLAQGGFRACAGTELRITFCPAD